jgi:cell division protein FtsB
MKEDFKQKIVWWVAIAFLGIVLTGGFIAIKPDYERSRKLKEQEAEVECRIREKRREIAQLEENLRRFKTEKEFVETIARQKKRVYPGEIVFLFED